MFSSPLECLRQKSWLAAIPDIIDVPAIGDQFARVVAIDHATVDEIEFALVQLDRELSDRYRLIGALNDVLKMARRQGARGGDGAVATAARDLEAGQ